MSRGNHLIGLLVAVALAVAVVGGPPLVGAQQAKAVDLELKKDRSPSKAVQVSDSGTVVT